MPAAGSSQGQVRRPDGKLRGPCEDMKQLWAVADVLLLA